MVKKSDTRKVNPSSICSDSKDENWSDENYEEGRIPKLSQPIKKDSEKKAKLNRRQSSSSNR